MSTTEMTSRSPIRDLDWDQVTSFGTFLEGRDDDGNKIVMSRAFMRDGSVSDFSTTVGPDRIVRNVETVVEYTPAEWQLRVRSGPFLVACAPLWS